MNKAEKLELIRQTGVIAILRARGPEQLVEAAEAIRRGGVRVLEVSLTTPQALAVIENATRKFGEEVLFGAGTVLDAAGALAVIQAGAGFVVAPTFNPEVVKVCQAHQVPVVPGCFTPAEMLTAWESGADLIKLFPADLGGPRFVKAILAPLPQLPIVAVGGVSLDNAAEYIRHGAVAVGLGSSLITEQLLATGNFAELTRRAAAFIEQIKGGRSIS